MSSICNILQFNNLRTIDSLLEKNESLNELKSLGVDEVHFSGEFPTIFFKKVKSFNSETLKKIAEIHHILWNYKKVLFLYVTSLTEIRIYNCSSKPFNYKDKLLNTKNELKKLELAKSETIDDLKKLLKIFSASAIDSGSIWSINNKYIKKIKQDKRIDKFLAKSLSDTAKKLENGGLSLDTVHSLIMRSLFIMYLEDKGATPSEFYEYKEKEFNSYFDLLEDKKATYSFFKKIKVNFNGNVFPVSEEEENSVDIPHLKLIKQCFTNGDIDKQSLFTDWRIFKFDIIEIELLSEIYENFLGKLKKKKTGSYYTPSSLVELILNEVLPVKNNETNYNLKILDPTCGSGIFLVEAYKRIVQRWINAHPNEILDFKILKYLMKNSIYGIELNPKSIKVATFSLYLALLDFLNPKRLWYQNAEKFPYLINDKDNNIVEQGYNLFRADAINIEENLDFIKEYDLIVGNPPYGRKTPLNVKAYCNEYNFAPEFVIPFIHKASSLSPKGKISLVVPTKAILTNTSSTSQNFRRWLFNDNYVEKVYNLSIFRKTEEIHGGGLFSSAIAPVSILFFQKEIPKKILRTIEYWAPKTYIKNNIADGIIIDSSDIKFLPRSECQKPNTKIWKIAQWGKLSDFNLLSNFLQEKSFLNYLDKKDIIKHTGFQLMTNLEAKLPKPNDELSKLGYLKAKSINRFYTNKKEKSDINKSVTSKEAKLFYTKYHNTSLEDLPSINLFHRNGNIQTFSSSHVLIKEGFSDNLFCATYLDYECTFTKTVLGLKGDDKDILKLITCYLNSTFSTYFLFLTSSSWGIERERVKPNELYLLPYISENIDVNKIVQVYDNIKSEINKNYPLTVNIENYENDINTLVSESFGISVNEQIFIEDTIDYSLDLFNKGSKSIAMKPIDLNNPETLFHAKKLCEELNETLVDSDLKLVSKVYKVSYYNPLTLVVFKFVSKDENILDVELLESDSEFNKTLLEINKFTLEEYSKSVYIQKQICYYDEDKIMMIKPNQKRFWTKSQAIEDAQNITLEIMSMP